MFHATTQVYGKLSDTDSKEAREAIHKAVGSLGGRALPYQRDWFGHGTKLHGSEAGTCCKGCTDYEGVPSKVHSAQSAHKIDQPSARQGYDEISKREHEPHSIYATEGRSSLQKHVGNVCKLAQSIQGMPGVPRKVQLRERKRHILPAILHTLTIRLCWLEDGLASCRGQALKSRANSLRLT